MIAPRSSAHSRERADTSSPGTRTSSVFARSRGTEPLRALPNDDANELPPAVSSGFAPDGPKLSPFEGESWRRRPALCSSSCVVRREISACCFFPCSKDSTNT